MRQQYSDEHGYVRMIQGPMQDTSSKVLDIMHVHLSCTCTRR